MFIVVSNDLKWKIMGFRRQGKVYHLRIRRPTRTGNDGKPVKMYQLENGVYFDSLYSLVVNYRINPLKSPVSDWFVLEKTAFHNFVISNLEFQHRFQQSSSST